MSVAETAPQTIPLPVEWDSMDPIVETGVGVAYGPGWVHKAWEHRGLH